MRRLTDEQITQTIAAINECGGSRVKAAQRLGIHYITLFKRIERFDPELKSLIVPARRRTGPRPRRPLPAAAAEMDAVATAGSTVAGNYFDAADDYLRAARAVAANRRASKNKNPLTRPPRPPAAAVVAIAPAPSAPPPTESELWAAYHAARSIEARNKLVEFHLPFANKLAHKLFTRTPFSVAHDTLFSAAAESLIGAVEKFDPTVGVKFPAYAVRRINGAMLDYLRSMDQVPRLTRLRERQRHAAESELTTIDGIRPTAMQVMEHLSWSVQQYVASLAPKSGSLEYVTAGDEEEGFASGGEGVLRAGDGIESRPDNPATRSTGECEIREIARGMNFDETVMLYLYHRKGASMKVIGEAMGLSESRVSQVHSKLIEKLRERGREWCTERLIG